VRQQCPLAPLPGYPCSVKLCSAAQHTRLDSSGVQSYTPAMITSPSGLQYEDTVEGQGASPERGQSCSMHYTGWLWEDGKKGAKFDSSLDRGRPFSFQIGVGQVIKGWDEGVASMKIGGKRTLLIPADLGYGARGAGGAIPPNATLVFEVELLGVS
jgi:peptidylprolyl isomerase